MEGRSCGHTVLNDCPLSRQRHRQLRLRVVESRLSDEPQITFPAALSLARPSVGVFRHIPGERILRVLLPADRGLRAALDDMLRRFLLVQGNSDSIFTLLGCDAQRGVTRVCAHDALCGLSVHRARASKRGVAGAGVIELRANFDTAAYQTALNSNLGSESMMKSAGTKEDQRRQEKLGVDHNH